MKKQITFPLKIDKDLWDEFKDHVPRTIKLNDIITSLIKEHLIKKEKGK